MATDVDDQQTEMQNWILKKYQGWDYGFGSHPHKKETEIIQTEIPVREKIRIQGLKIKTQYMPTFGGLRNKNPEGLPWVYDQVFTW